MGTKADKSLQTVIEQPVHSHGCSNLCIVAIIGHITSPFIRKTQQISVDISVTVLFIKRVFYIKYFKSQIREQMSGPEIS